MEPFNKEEKMFRAVRPPQKNKFFWTKDKKRITPLAFKNRQNERSVSVDRQETRNINDCIIHMQERLEGSIVSVTYTQCCMSEIKVVPHPTKTDPYHCGLENERSDAENSLLTDIQCQNLADAANFEYKDFE